MLRRVLAPVGLALTLTTACSSSSGGHPDKAAVSSSRAASAASSFVTSSNAALASIGPLPDARLTQLADALCLDLGSRGAGDVAPGAFVQQIPENASQALSDEDASDFAQVAVRWDCPEAYSPLEFINPGKYAGQQPRTAN